MCLSEYMRIMCPDVTTKTRRRCWMPLELELQVFDVGTKSECSERTGNVLNL